MRRSLLIFVCVGWLAGFMARGYIARAQSSSGPSRTAGGAETIVDGVAARIEDDILTESEVRELCAFQKLVDGAAKARADRIRELADQWIVRVEADAAKFEAPASGDVDRAYTKLAAQFPSPEEFKDRCAAAGITEAAVRRILGQQLYLSRFLDYRFRPAAQVDQKQIEAYYNNEFVPQLKTRNQTVPPLDDLRDTIREVLIQRTISERANEWLDEARSRLKIDVISEGDRP